MGLRALCPNARQASKQTETETETETEQIHPADAIAQQGEKPSRCGAYLQSPTSPTPTPPVLGWGDADDGGPRPQPPWGVDPNALGGSCPAPQQRRRDGEPPTRPPQCTESPRGQPWSQRRCRRTSPKCRGRRGWWGHLGNGDGRSRRKCHGYHARRGQRRGEFEGTLYTIHRAKS